MRRKKRYVLTPRHKVKLGELIRITDENVLLVKHGSKVDYITFKEIEAQFQGISGSNPEMTSAQK